MPGGQSFQPYEQIQQPYNVTQPMPMATGKPMTMRTPSSQMRIEAGPEQNPNITKAMRTAKRTLSSPTPSGVQPKMKTYAAPPEGMVPQGFQPMNTGPTPRLAKRTVVPDFDQPPATTEQVRMELGNASKGLRTAIQQKNDQDMANYLDSVRSQAETMKSRMRNLGPDSNLKLSTISHIYERGADLIEEGQRTGDDSKVRLGIEKIDDANRQLDNIGN